MITDQTFQAFHAAVGLVARLLGDPLHLVQELPLLGRCLEGRAQRCFVLCIGFLQQLLLIAAGAFVVAIDGVLEQIEAVQPHLALLAGFGRPFLQRVPVHLQRAIKRRNRAEQALLQVGDHQVLGGPFPFAGGSEPLVAQFPVAAEQFSQFQLRGAGR